MSKRPSSALFLAFWLVGCGDSGGAGGYTVADILDQPPQGRIGGSEWTLADTAVKRQMGDLNCELYGEVVDACSYFDNDLPTVLFSVPDAVGEYPLQFASSTDSYTVTLFTPPTDNNVASEGIVSVEAISDTEVTVGLIAYIDSDNEINGRFSVAPCP